MGAGRSADQILSLLTEAQALASKVFGIENILQPGIVKELIMASALGHELTPQKDGPDSRDQAGNTYEYLSSIHRGGVGSNRGCSFQIDRLTKDNLFRVTRNKAFYFGIFNTHLELNEMWRVDTKTVLHEVERQLTGCKNAIAHVNVLSKWVKENGVRAHPKSPQHIVTGDD